MADVVPAQGIPIIQGPGTGVVPTPTTEEAPPAPLAPPLPALQPLTRDGMLLTSLQQAGFVVPSGSFPYARILADISGPEKTGKTRVALTSTQPVVYLAFDVSNLVGVVEEFVRAGRQIAVKNLAFPPPATQEADARIYNPYYQAFLAAIDMAIQLPRGTIVIDTGQHVEQLVRLSLYGKLKGVGTFSYEQRNTEMEAIFAKLSGCSLNVIWLHNVKKVWQSYIDNQGQTRNAWNGSMEPDRFELVGQRVQMNMTTRREYDPQTMKWGNFRLYTANNRLASQLAGTDYVVPMGDMMTIPTVMSWIFQAPAESFL